MKIEILKLNCVNKNNRMYTTECVLSAINGINHNTVYGELSMPTDSGTVDLTKVSHKIDKILSQSFKRLL
jgi:hypothetical protein